MKNIDDKNKNNKPVHSKNRIRSQLQIRIILNSILLIVFLSTGIVFSLYTIEKQRSMPINYNERGLIDYKVYLKDNDFYSDNYLPKGKTYIASLIDYIDADVNYIFRIDQEQKIDFEYKIVSELVIENSKGTSRYFEKKSDLTEFKKKSLEAGNELLIKENIKIDYGQYNLLANKFRSQYGIDSTSYLKIYINVKKEIDPESGYELNETKNIDIVNIPLSEKALEININSSDSNIQNQIVSTEAIQYNKIILILTFIFFLLAIYTFINIIINIMMISRLTCKYDKIINKILRDYDRLIVEVKTTINFDKYNITRVNKFSELLDVRDNLKLPINYFVVEPHKKGLFYIKCNDDIYLLVVTNKSI